MLDFAAIDRAPVQRTPFSYVLAEGVLSQQQAREIRRDYPAITKPGYLPLSAMQPRGAFAILMEDLQGAQMAQILGDKFGVNLADKPRMITVRRLSQHSDGTIHRDSRSKILTLLIYLNESWDGDGAGVLRVLRSGDSMDDFAAQVAPLAGSFFAFLRSDTSWHGHLPYSGERYVVQMAFLTSQAELDRKEKRGRLQLFLKKLNPFQ